MSLDEIDFIFHPQQGPVRAQRAAASNFVRDAATPPLLRLRAGTPCTMATWLKIFERVRLEFSGCRVRALAARSGGAAGVSHDNPRAQTCSFQGPCASKHHQNSTRRPRETQKERNGGGEREEKERNFGRSGGRGVQGSLNQQQPQQPQPQQRQTQNKWGPEGPARSPKQGLGFVSSGVGHNNNNTQHNNTTTQQNNKTTQQQQQHKITTQNNNNNT